MNRAPIVALVVALAAGMPAARVGVEMPAAGIDGAQGLAVRLAVRLSARAVMRDSAGGGFSNPHQDEGRDNDVDALHGPAIIRGFAADTRIIAAIGGLRRRVGDADAVAAQARHLPAIVLSRWSRNRPGAGVYCLCVSPRRLVGFARRAAGKHFGPRLLLALVGEAVQLEPIWTSRWGPVQIADVTDTERSVAAAQRQAKSFDAVLVLADERPPTLWQAAAFVRLFDLDFVRNLAHRDFQAIPSAAPRGSIDVIEAGLARSAARDAFERLFHAVAGYLPDDAATRAYAAAQIVTAAGTTRGSVRQALRARRFSTVAGSVAFDADGFANPYPLPALKSATFGAASGEHIPKLNLGKRGATPQTATSAQTGRASSAI